MLVSNVISSNTPELWVKEQDTWSSEDDGLLKILLCDRGCSMELISMVLKRSAEDISERIKYLDLNDGCSS